MLLAGGIVCGEAFPLHIPVEVALLVFCLLCGVMVVLYRCERTGLFGGAVFLFFFGYGYWITDHRLAQVRYDFSKEEVICKVSVCEEPEEKERSILCRSVVEGEWKDTVFVRNDGRPLFLLYFPKDSLSRGLRRGDRLLVHAKLTPPSVSRIPDGFDYARYLRHRGVSGTAYVPEGHWMKTGHSDSRSFRQAALDMREKVVDLYRSLGFQGDELAVLSALTVGDKDELSDEIVETYSVSGASHVLALSGLHIGFIYGLFFFFFSRLWLRWHYLKIPLSLLIIILLWLFALLTGLPASLVRSVTMCSLLILAGIQSEQVFSLDSLLATAFLMLFFHPLWLFDVGFQLSFLSVASILLIQPRLYAVWKVKNVFLRKVWGMMTMSVAAQIGVAPLIAFYFSRFSTHFLLTNLFVVPLVAFVMYSAVLLLVLTPFPFLQGLLVPFTKALLGLQNEGLRWIERLPYSSVDGIWVDFGVLLSLYLFLWCAYRFFRMHTGRNACWCMAALLITLSLYTGDRICSMPRAGIVFYNVRGCPAVHCLTDGRRSWLVCTDSLADVSPLHQAMSSHWNRMHLQPPVVVRGNYTDGALWVENQIVSYAGKRVCIVSDGRWEDWVTNAPLPVDYLYLAKGYSGSVSDLVSLFVAGKVVVDASLPAYQRREILEDCIRLKLPYKILEKDRVLEEW